MLRLFSFLLLAGSIGCGSSSPDPGSTVHPTGSGGMASQGGSKSTATGGSAAGGTTGTSVGPTSSGGKQSTATGGSAAGGTSGTIVSTGGSGTTPSSNASSYADIPCNVGAILQQNCASCHGPTPNYGAPMSLTSAADFAKKALDGTHTVGQAVLTRINDDQHPMPQPPSARLSAADTSTLTSWIQGGAKAETCSNTNTGNLSPTDVITTDPSGPGITCYDIVARDSDGNKYSVPTTPDYYHEFNYAPPWGSTKVHMISWRPLTDNKAVLHHWLLYNTPTPVVDKTDSGSNGAHPGAQLTAGWAPGGRGFVLPPDVGEDVSGPGFTIEMHYNNNTGAPSPDASGIRLCVTTNIRPIEAGVHWLGTEAIMLPAGGDAVGTCVPSGTGPITILSSIPHMHLQGRHMKSVINRKDGTKDVLFDKPFDFNTQIGYDTPAVVQPGDTLTTTCTYGGLAIFGEGTKNEMCYAFVLAYPNGSLSSPSMLRKNGCTGL